MWRSAMFKQQFLMNMICSMRNLLSWKPHAIHYMVSSCDMLSFVATSTGRFLHRSTKLIHEMGTLVRRHRELSINVPCTVATPSNKSLLEERTMTPSPTNSPLLHRMPVNPKDVPGAVMALVETDDEDDSKVNNNFRGNVGGVMDFMSKLC